MTTKEENKNIKTEENKKQKSQTQKDKSHVRILLVFVFIFYLLLPMDLIPDILPIIGYLDDSLALFGVLYIAFSPIAEKISNYFKK